MKNAFCNHELICHDRVWVMDKYSNVYALTSLEDIRKLDLPCEDYSQYYDENEYYNDVIQKITLVENCWNDKDIHDIPADKLMTALNRINNRYDQLVCEIKNEYRIKLEKAADDKNYYMDTLMTNIMNDRQNLNDLTMLEYEY
jgi:hypothetical protein